MHEYSTIKIPIKLTGDLRVVAKVVDVLPLLQTEHVVEEKQAIEQKSVNVLCLLILGARQPVHLPIITSTSNSFDFACKSISRA